MEVNNSLGIEYRVVKDSEYLGQPVRLVGGSRTYSVEINELWDAVTNPERLALWFAPISGELKPGGRFQLEGNAGGDIVHCEPPKALDVTWECGSMSWVTVRLEPATDGTRLTLEHLIPKDDASEAHWKKYGPGATGVGWDLGFLGLSLYLKNGEAVDENQLVSTPEGKTFMKDSAKSWGEAHVQSGEADATASVAAAETAKFYCGD